MPTCTAAASPTSPAADRPPRRRQAHTSSPSAIAPSGQSRSRTDSGLELSVRLIHPMSRVRARSTVALTGARNVVSPVSERGGASTASSTSTGRPAVTRSRGATVVRRSSAASAAIHTNGTA